MKYALILSASLATLVLAGPIQVRQPAVGCTSLDCLGQGECCDGLLVDSEPVCPEDPDFPEDGVCPGNGGGNRVPRPANRPRPADKPDVKPATVKPDVKPATVNPATVKPATNKPMSTQGESGLASKPPKTPSEIKPSGDKGKEGDECNAHEDCEGDLKCFAGELFGEPNSCEKVGGTIWGTPVTPLG
ncbi:hypothetical protein QQS21_012364 [Conoideocrella luteorostrata]|uniref:Uncharacterized protein n=1 Tax=Conoideocrella luteorostrata TaxID=1105319 RepID=A0AAJ0CBN4_9HYPO|nr:hypothetical protein QQS21_012364 [Conoideocrella luteorostrata]